MAASEAREARESLVNALTAGAQAGRNGEPPTTCPYPRGTLLRSAWIRGYAKARPLPVANAD